MLSFLRSAQPTPKLLWNTLLRLPHTRAAPVAVGSSATAQLPSGRDSGLPLRAKRARSMRSMVSIGQSPFDFNPDSEGASLGEVVLCPKWGVDVLHDPLYNKGSAFLLEERERLHLRGLIPPREYTLEGLDPLTVQAHRVLTRYRTMPSDLAKYSFLTSLQDRNEVLFYRVLLDNIREMAPIIYTPTVGQACLDFNQIWRRSRGMYFSAKDRGHMHAMTWNWPIDDVQIIVVTDGSRILGLGDLGANGMGIPIGKLSLYTACAGIHPSRCLPVLLDVGTNNEKLRQDELYLGLQQPRITGADYDAVVDEFLRAVAERWPNACVQFEDFSNDHAEPILTRYRNEMLCFNDDIQGTGAVTLAAVLNAVRVIEGGRQTDPEAASRSLSKQRILIVGAGSAGLGVANSLCTGMTSFGAASREHALSRFLMYDANGTLGVGRAGVTAAQAPFVRSDIKDGSSLLDAIEQFKPTALIGLTGIGGLFREEHIRAMRKHCERPIIFPLSNPTSRAECTAQQAYEWTGGSAVFASGSPFAPVSYQGRTLTPAQANNMFTFPGIGLGAIASGALHITDSMLHSAAVALSRSVSDELLSQGRIFPDIAQIRTVSENVAVAVASSAAKEELASVECDYSDEAAVRKLLSRVMWNPRYGSMVARR